MTNDEGWFDWDIVQYLTFRDVRAITISKSS
jgi:hypothetical protein